ncbi:MAG: TIGR01620 family protein [Pseudomonadota bacterium]
MSKGPVLFELEDAQDAPQLTPASAPAVPDFGDEAPSGQAMQTIAHLAARKPSKLVRLFWGSLITLIGFMASIAAWEFVMGLIENNPILGYIALGLTAIFCAALLLIALREWLALVRLRRVDGLRSEADGALAASDLKAARKVATQVEGLYRARPELDAARADHARKQGDQFDAGAVFVLTEQTLLAPLDRAASREVEAAARQVATITALVPIALADLIGALTANLRMIRRIAEIYGGRAGTLGNWRLTRAVMTHLVATGAVAVGDDLIGSVAGGTVLGRISRRFGEGVVNGALTARVGVAAIEVCRPLPFVAAEKPSVTSIIKNSLTGLFSKT